MAPQWSHEAIDSLICAYREEQCLYVVGSRNYSNKHLRAEALKRVASAVCNVRPNTTTKECYDKMHGLRNQFNHEHAKVKSSRSSGAGLNDVYVPSLWYYPKLLFLVQHCRARTSISLGLGSQHSEYETSDYAYSQSSVQSGDDLITMDLEVITPHCLLGTGEPQTASAVGLSFPMVDLLPSAGPSSAGLSTAGPSSAGPSTAGPSTAGPSTAGPSTAGPSTAVAGTLLSPQADTPSRPRGRKRPADSYVSAVEVIAKTITSKPANATQASKVDHFCNFLGACIKEIDDDQQMELMADLLLLVTRAKKNNAKHS